ncbi:pirin family protein [Aquimarina sp. U1-2]|uniref:pirin family protein n=1 Tax=Aquimarina sp. U1-2 TaxID=2823141 RepID=UPI001AECCB76|nr:pirin family protein [Aquimarina sp. U1-2]MBP2831955.1 pirin family protein [Aquimarina sp. U1-2]
MDTKKDTSILHTADSRGEADHGWLHSRHTFSFANYYNPDRMNFGVLRVLNDDIVTAGRGFGAHPHSNMEIVSIPLSGALKHMDSTGRSEVIQEGDIQVMSAGSGIQHSEMNANNDAEVQFLQIWIIPNKENITPRYDQISLHPEDRKNKLQQILSPNPEDDGVWIYQDAWFHLGTLDAGIQLEYTLKIPENGVYIFVLDGSVTINDQVVQKRDGYGLWNVSSFTIQSNLDTELLLMEVPMTV